MLYCIIIPAACKGVFSHFRTTSVLAVGGAVCYTDNNYEKIQKPQEEMTVKQSLSFARRLAALVLAALAAEGDSVIYGSEYIDRGYERLDLMMSRLGADIRKDEGNE